jgi:hypothetical protein
VSVRILEQLATGSDIGAINVGVTDDGAFAYRVDDRAAAAASSSPVGTPSYTMPSTEQPLHA